MYRTRSEIRNPCAVCGWAPHMALHQLIVDGPRAGQYWGRGYVDASAAAPGGATENAQGHMKTNPPAAGRGEGDSHG